MELWIRSQDKNVLENVKGFCITHSVETHWHILNVDTTTRYGTYKTKERVLEVLDEIQEAKLGNFHYKCPSNVKVSSKEDTIVYEMPKE